MQSLSLFCRGKNRANFIFVVGLALSGCLAQPPAMEQPDVEFDLPVAPVTRDRPNPSDTTADSETSVDDASSMDADASMDATADGSDADDTDVAFLTDPMPAACNNDPTMCPTRPGTTASCRGGLCRYRCAGTFGDCDGDIRNGCEVDTNTTVSNCGACGTVCRGATNATPQCMAGICTLQCNGGTSDCDRDRSNGCEADTNSNPENCGTCATRCNSAANAAASCNSGVCGLLCAQGFANCDANGANGCERPTSADVDNCGACNMRCPSGANSTPACNRGVCELTCAPGFLNCDGNPANGCEVNGATDAMNCGRCTQACPMLANGTNTCRAGSCNFACSPGFFDCDGNQATGCELDTRNNVSNCGMCGRVCTTVLPGSVAACVNSMCSSQCAMGFANCDGNDMNGCEINTTASPRNCGACGNVCPSPPNTVPTCSGSTCGYQCSPGYVDCDGNSATGCERMGASC